MNQENRITALERAVRLLIEADRNSQKLIVGLLQVAARQGVINGSLIKMNLNPDTATPAFVGKLHDTNTQSEFIQESTDEIENLLDDCSDTDGKSEPS